MRRRIESTAGSSDSSPSPALRTGGASPSQARPPSAGPLREALRPPGPPRLELSVVVEPESGSVVRVEGELDILTAPKLAARLDGLIRGSAGELIIDLRAVEFIDSSGLQLLMGTRRRLLREARNLAVLCDDGPVRRVIEIARLTEPLGVIDSGEDSGTPRTVIDL